VLSSGQPVPLATRRKYIPVGLLRPSMDSDSRQQHWLTLALLACVLGFFSPASFAESLNFGQYTVHYIAVNSTFLTPEIAAQYKIVRSSRRAFLNIAVLRNNADGSTTPVAATVEGGKRNLMQQQGNIDFAEVREGEAIYYIGQFDFSNAEIVRFAVDVTPAGESKAQAIEWSTQLYAD